ncbi:type IV pilus biogenesis/stability protein PilW [Mannheimia granulomatis]|uniref:type IV pilus biogenesis/stability protein PilW n=1 Tax=Mannheimia granulomatis TaxID=85402 RepID=UPI00159DAB78|nr:type IV pilus biogenesis/stability protein PilW [Mannheimia granulomatis]QLB15362.1 type IV pilus biogenesis/stability protein PilW [Mannheimia granulomatis]
MFVKFFRKMTACVAIVLLAACSSSQDSSPEPEFRRSEAVKARINLALAYLEQNDFPKAKQNIDKALAHDSQDYLPYSVLAYYYQQTGDVENAEKAYQKALNLSENRPDVLNNYGTFLCKQGQFQQAYQQFEKAIQSPKPYYHQADSLANIILCAKKEPNPQKVVQTLIELEKLDKLRANLLKETK